ncbi:uncharacterized protein LOC108251394 [Kryptolebias marmoratus]|uniref:uncharacterized protein LOC108251394 n=1 Tax=Kryptolebias marmoratus TaxID=37003 RepID=UPI0018AC9863|nr:uncharacterized protein LOC108251394 [Kryptolebias marmoratus]
MEVSPCQNRVRQQEDALSQQNSNIKVKLTSSSKTSVLFIHHLKMLQRILLFVLSGFIITENIQKIKKQTGDMVTLRGNTTEHPISWTFQSDSAEKKIFLFRNGKVAPVNGSWFGKRLNVDVKTGSITITNLKSTDSGAFLCQTSVAFVVFQLVIEKTFLQVNILVGENVTLESNVKKQQRQTPDHIYWGRGDIYVGEGIIRSHFLGEAFESVKCSKCYLNPVTGDLTFFNVLTNLTGEYCVEVVWTDGQSIEAHYKMNVYEPVSVPNITAKLNSSGLCDVTCFVKNVPNVTLSWDENIRKSDAISSTALSLELNEGVFTCEAKNPVSAENATLRSNAACPDERHIGWIVAGILVVLGVLAVATLRIKRGQKRDDVQTQIQVPLSNISRSSSEESDESLLNNREENGHQANYQSI